MRCCIALLVASTFTACATLRSVTAEERKNIRTVTRLFDAIQAGDLATFNELSDPEGVLHTASGGTRKFGGPFSELRDACPMCVSVQPRDVHVDLVFAKGDLVAVRSTLRGTQVGPIVGVAPTGKQFQVSYINIYRVRNNRIVENWVGLDRLGLAQQLGQKLCADESRK